MAFRKYMHVERFGNDKVKEIVLGTCYVFPKIDGTNGSLWSEDGKLCAGRRRAQIESVENDNFGFLAAVSGIPKYMEFFKEFPNLRLYGEWMIPHSLKTYKDSVWDTFWVFDVYDDVSERHLEYEEYKSKLDSYDIEYIVPISIITNGSYEAFCKELDNNIFLIKDGEGVGEGIVIKNYSFVCRDGFVRWAKIITSDFKELHHKKMGAPVKEGKTLVEEKICNKYITKHFVDKVYYKIYNEVGWESKYIPRLLNTVYYDLITEEMWDILKKYKNPIIDFKTLHTLVVRKIREVKSELF
jgi:hypothetical protein